MADDGSAQPQNIQEFNQIAVVIFAQLYIEHPIAKTVDVAEVAALLGKTPTTVLPSGRSFMRCSRARFGGCTNRATPTRGAVSALGQ